jgi:CARDB
VKQLSLVLAALTLSGGLATSVTAGPDLRPKFGGQSGTVRVTNSGDADAAGSWVTVHCAPMGGGACPDPAPADAAPYLNPAFPDVVAIAVPPLSPGQQHNHVIGFFDALAFAPGSYAFTVCADAGSDVAEDSERNNCIKVKKSVVGRVGGPRGLKNNTGSP